jgi:integrase
MTTMPTLTRAPNGDHFSRKAIPADVRDAYAAAYGVKREALFRLEATATETQAKRAYGEWLAEVEGRIDALRAVKSGSFVSLSQRESHALCGRWYAWFVGQSDDEPGDEEQWDHIHEQYEDVLSSAGGIGAPDEDADAPIGAAHRRRVHAKLTELARLPSFLATEALELDRATTARVLDALAPDFRAALALLRRRAGGDYTPDQRAERFPTVARPAVKVAGWNAWQAFEAWVKERQPAPATINRWRSVLDELNGHFDGKDVADYTGDDAVAWKSTLVSDTRSARVANEVWLTAARTVFSWVKAQKKISANPFEGVVVAGPKKPPKTREREFNEDEIKIILGAALMPQGASRNAHLRAARRWVPWLCAYTGARPGEMTQLRKEDVREHKDGFWTVHINPEAGAVKGQTAREVVLHGHLIEQGFPEFVGQCHEGPLFYGVGEKGAGLDDPLNPKRPPYVLVRQKLGDWVRGLGVTDKGISPNHSWRHTFKRRAARAGMEQRIRDAFCGHSDGRVGAIYETPTVEDLAEAIKVFPRYQIEAE